MVHASPIMPAAEAIKTFLQKKAVSLSPFMRLVFIARLFAFKRQEFDSSWLSENKNLFSPTISRRNTSHGVLEWVQKLVPIFFRILVSILDSYFWGLGFFGYLLGAILGLLRLS